MKYLFLDAECANCENGRGKIYSIGYIIADDDLNIVENEKDLIINPNIKAWDLYVVKNILAYPKKDVEEQPKFNEQYNKIKCLMEGDDTIVCGFSVKDDIGYILDECSRYNLEPIRMIFFDVQRLDSKISCSRKKKLSEAYNLWCKETPSKVHRSDIDARLTFEVAKRICDVQKKSIQIFMSEDETLYGQTDGFRYGFNDERLETKDERKARKEEKKLLRFAKRKKNEINNCNDKNCPKTN